jgi:spore coat polysaccharide biosynthesis protein SpsF (cytidylyltransferase family)
MPMKYLAIIQARCGSSRLPGKILKDLCGKTALERVIQRVQKCRYVDEIIVATTINKEDIKVVKLVSSLGIRVFAGSPDDVLDRYYQTAKLVKPEYIIRITADCPVFDYKILEQAVEEMDEETDYMWAFSETFADGLDLEIMKSGVLEDAWRKARLASEREHVTLYIKNHKEDYKVQDFICRFGNLHDERWTIDEPEDYDFIKTLYEHFYNTGKKDFLSEDILEYLNKHPEIREINKGFIRNEGLMVSLKNDKTINIKEQE